MCMTPDELNAAVHELKQLKTLDQKITEKIKTLEDQLKLHMSDTNMSTIIGDDYNVSWYEVSSSRLDIAAIKRDLPDIATQYTHASVTRRFIVS